MITKKAWYFAVVVLAVNAPLRAADMSIQDNKPAVVDAAMASVTATVEKIDYKTRMVTLKGQDGTVETIEIGPEAQRFNEVKKGDIVQVDYLESVAILVQSPDQNIATAEGSHSVLIRNKGKKPSGVIVQTDVETATVEKIDAKKRTAVIRDAQGMTQHIDISPDVQHLENVKKGDQVVIKHTRRVGINVTKPKK